MARSAVGRYLRADDVVEVGNRHLQVAELVEHLPLLEVRVATRPGGN
ncbi:MAG: hypothetical protein ACRD2T_00760 [Thermoanaerobaculia bacterium]